MKPGDTYHGMFVVSDPITGAAVDADSLPTATLSRNGVDLGAVVMSVVHMDTGRYRISAVIPGECDLGDVVHVTVAATVDGVAAKGVVDTIELTSVLDEPLSEHSTSGTAGAALGRVGSAALSVVSPVATDGEITIYQGDSYTATRVLSFTIEDYSGPSLDGEDGTFRLLPLSQYEGSGTAAALEVECTYAQAGTTVTVDVALTAIQTAGLDTAPPKNTGYYRYQLQATPGEDVITVATGSATVWKVITDAV